MTICLARVERARLLLHSSRTGRLITANALRSFQNDGKISFDELPAGLRPAGSTGRST
jgi:hypothetical protein